MIQTVLFGRSYPRKKMRSSGTIGSVAHVVLELHRRCCASIHLDYLRENTPKATRLLQVNFHA